MDNIEMISYHERLAERPKYYKASIQKILQDYKGTGSGYFYIIFELDKAIAAIDAFSELGVAIRDIHWFCLWTIPPLTGECPHGMGGPNNEYGEGQYLECIGGGYKDYEIEEHVDNFNDLLSDSYALVNAANRVAKDYLSIEFPISPIFSKCLHPAMSLLVPNEWQI